MDKKQVPVMDTLSRALFFYRYFIIHKTLTFSSFELKEQELINIGLLDDITW